MTDPDHPTDESATDYMRRIGDDYIEIIKHQRKANPINWTELANTIPEFCAENKRRQSRTGPLSDGWARAE